MRHHQHAGLAGSLDPRQGGSIVPHPDLADADARLQVWVPLPDPDGRGVDALEALTCVATRAGAVRVVAVPHVALDVALGDELAIGDWEGEPMARGQLASSLHGTVRAVGAAGTTWQSLAARLDAVAPGAWFDVMGDTAVAASVPRGALREVFALLDELAARDEVRWEYATPGRHAPAEA